jgi:stage II sporulation protein R
MGGSMKKLIAIFSVSFLVLCAITVITSAMDGAQIENAFLRLHIRADSNEKEAQAVKLKVRDAVLADVDNLLKGAGDKETAEKIVSDNIGSILKTADKVLAGQGFSYTAKARIGKSYFPTRDYGDYSLPAGEYDALIIELGSGKGDNWWCVLYPSLCKGTLNVSDTVLTEEGVTILSNGNKVNIRFKIIELWNGIKEKLS